VARIKMPSVATSIVVIFHDRCPSREGHPTARKDRAEWSDHHSTPFALASRPFFTALTNSS
jgi:hypothetical protein